MSITRDRRVGWRGLATVIVAGIGIAGCGAGSSPPRATAVAPLHGLAPASQTAAGTSLGHPGTLTQPAAPSIAAGRLVRVFAGTRNAGIGSLSAKTSLVVGWNAARPPIQIFSRQGILLLSSDRRTGRVRLGAGEYRGLRIATRGHWAIQLRAAA
jgi:hypothetical protein